MELLKGLMESLPLLVIMVWIEYRFACKTLGLKTSRILTFFIMFIGIFLAGRLNVYFHLAGTVDGNILYASIVCFLLFLLLFKGNNIKKLFFTVLINYGIPITFYILLPFVGCFFRETSAQYMFALQILQGINILVCIVLMEFFGKKFQNLRKELPFGYTIYLTAVLVFVQVAIYARYDGMLVRNDGIVSLSAACLSSAFAMAGMVIVIVAIFAVDRQVDVSLKEQLHMLQAENFKSRELAWRKFSSFRHDIKNHLLCLNNLLESGKSEQAASYMLNLTNTVKQFDSPVQTGNDYADALLSVKYAEALEANIKISLDMAIPADGYIEPIDICCILSNAFDNAIAACKKLPEGNKWIIARSFIKQGQFVISINNSKPPYVNVVDGEVFPKEIAADHGIGLCTVKTVVEKYGGTLNLSAADAFCFSVLLPHYRM